MARREVHGSREQAEKQLQRDCREQIAGAAPSRNEPTPKEKSLLAALAKYSVIDADPRDWQLFALGGNKLITVGVKPPLAKEAGNKQGKIAASQVVLWGIVLPKGENDWSELLFVPSKEVDSAIPLLSDIPLPPKCRKMLTVQAVNGGAMVAFSGPGRPENWRGHFEKSFAKGGWKPVFPWQNTASAWYAQYRGRYKDKSCTADVHFYPDGKGEMSGLVIVGIAEGDMKKAVP